MTSSLATASASWPVRPCRACRRLLAGLTALSCASGGAADASMLAWAGISAQPSYGLPVRSTARYGYHAQETPECASAARPCEHAVPLPPQALTAAPRAANVPIYATR